MKKIVLYLLGIFLVIVFILSDWFQFLRLEDLKEKTIYHNENAVQRIYYFLRSTLFNEAYRGDLDRIEVSLGNTSTYDYKEAVDRVKQLKEKNRIAEFVFFARSDPATQSFKLFYFDSTLAPAKNNERTELVLKTLQAFSKLIPTGETFGEDYSIRITENEILLTEPIINDTDNEVLGFTGIIFNTENVETQILPEIFQDIESQIDTAMYVIRLRDYPSRRILYTTSSAIEENQLPDYNFSIAFIFNNWRIEIFIMKDTIYDLALKEFYQNILISSFGYILLIAGILTLIRMTQKEKRLSDMKSDFIANISHELKTPLSVIQVASENLISEKITEKHKIKQYGEFIQKETQRLSIMVEKILSFVQINNGNYEYKFKNENINDLIQEIYNSYKIQFEKSGFQTHLDLDESLPTLKLDIVLFREALHNLIDNAIKYSDNDKQIEISTTLINDEVQISIKDKGIGISHRDQKFIFDKFYRAGSSSIHNTKGSGLGLTIAQQIVNDHKGHISVKSEPSQGSKFIIHLPVGINE